MAWYWMAKVVRSWGLRVGLSRLSLTHLDLGLDVTLREVHEVEDHAFHLGTAAAEPAKNTRGRP